MDQGIRLWRTRIEAVALGMLAALPLAPYLVSLVKTGIPRFAVRGDYAGLELATRFVWSGKTLLGPYSRFGFNHPGPLFFYLVAPVYLLAGKTSAGLYGGACAINAAAAATIAFAVRLLCTRAHAVAATVVVLAWLAAFGNACAQPWNPLVVTLPLLAFLTLSALFARGASVVAPFVVLLGALAAETHLSTVPTVGCVGLAAVVSFTAVVHHRGGLARNEKRHLLYGVGVLFLAISPPIVEQLTSAEGNLTKLFHFFVRRAPLPLSFGAALRHWVQATSWLPERIFERTLLTEGDGSRVSASEPIPEVPARFAIQVATAWLVAVAAAAVVAIRRRDSASVAFLATSVLACAIAVIALRAVVGPTYYYLLFWTTAASTLAWMGVATTFWGALDALLRRSGPTAARAGRAAAVVVALAAGTAVTSLQGTWLARNRLAPPVWQAMRNVYPILLARLRTTGETPMIHLEGAWDAALSVLLELTKDGITPRVARRDEWILGRQFRTSALAPKPLDVYPRTLDHEFDLAPCLDPIAQSADLQLFVAPADISCPPGTRQRGH